jgi:GGDEF domain-containing protein
MEASPMSTPEIHGRDYIQARLREEVARHARHGHPFGLLVFEARTGDGVPLRVKLDALAGALATRLRPSDVIARVFDDTIVVLLVETDSAGSHDVLFRLRSLLAQAGMGTSWQIECLNYPQDDDALAALPLMSAA